MSGPQPNLLRHLDDDLLGAAGSAQVADSPAPRTWQASKVNRPASEVFATSVCTPAETPSPLDPRNDESPGISRAFAS
jgi:hypothetical protein